MNHISTNNCYAVGICNAAKCAETANGKYGFLVDGDSYGVAFGYSQPYKFKSETCHGEYARQPKVNDRIEMKVDLSRRELSYSINGKDYGVAFDGIRTDIAWRMGVVFNSQNDEIELLEYAASCVV